MRISRDRRPIAKQAKSGLKIAGAMVASLTALALTAISYELIVDLDGSHHVVLGWLLMCAAVLAMTAQYWRHWFYFLPGYVMMRSLLWVFFGWFSPKGYLFIVFLLLMAAMAGLSYRFSQSTRIFVTDRIALMSALACLIGSIAGMWLREPTVYVLIPAGLGDLILLLQWNVIRQHFGTKRKAIQV